MYRLYLTEWYPSEMQGSFCLQCNISPQGKKLFENDLEGEAHELNQEIFELQERRLVFLPRYS